nr:hypothetical protein [Tanacetum cinerariifolium]
IQLDGAGQAQRRVQGVVAQLLPRGRMDAGTRQGGQVRFREPQHAKMGRLVDDKRVVIGRPQQEQAARLVVARLMVDEDHAATGADADELEVVAQPQDNNPVTSEKTETPKYRRHTRRALEACVLCSILIVEDEFLIANNLQRILVKAGYQVTGLAKSVAEARQLLAQVPPDIVLLDIFLKGEQTGIDLAHWLNEQHIPFVFLSANLSDSVLEAAKVTHPFGFLNKPFRTKDVLTTLEIARYRH